MTSPHPVLAGYMLEMSGPYACFTFMYVQNLSVAHGLEARLLSLPFIFDFLWRELFFDVSFFDGLLPLGAGPCLIVGFYFFSPFFCSFLQSCCHFLL